MPAAPGRHPHGLLKGALRLQILNIYRASSGLRWICDHERRRNEIRKGPARSRKSAASRRVQKSYGARWICESPLRIRSADVRIGKLPIHRNRAPSFNPAVRPKTASMESQPYTSENTRSCDNSYSQKRLICLI